MPLTIPLKAGAAALALAAAGLGAACGGFGAAATPAATPADAHGTAPFVCEIGLADRPGGRELVARVTADRPLAGRYALDVARTGGGGEAVIRQSGAFTARPGRTEELGRVAVDAGARLAATLAITWNGRTWTCRAADPIEI